jgi:hypothetical protein
MTNLSSDNLFNLEFDLTTYQIFVHITSSQLQMTEEAPSEAIGLARLKIAGAKAEGTLTDFEIYPERFAEVWKLARLKMLQHDLRIEVAAGLPKLDGFHISLVSEDQDHVAYISFNRKFDFENTKPEWLILALRLALIRAKTEPVFDSSAVTAVFYQERHHPSYKRFSIPRSPAYRMTNPQTPFQVYTNRKLQSIFCWISQVIQRPDQFEGLMSGVMERIESLSLEKDASKTYLLLSDEIQSHLRVMRSGHECLGLELPRQVLCAVGLPVPESGSYYTVLSQRIRSIVANNSKPENWLNDEIKKNLTTPPKDKSYQSLLLPEFVRAGNIFCSHFAEANKLAGESLKRTAPDLRNFQALTLALPEARARQLCHDLVSFTSKFVRDISRQKQANSPIYCMQFNIQFFPFTREGANTYQLKSTVSKSDQASLAWKKLLLRELVGLVNFRPTPQWIIPRVYAPFRDEEISEGLEQLKNQGFLRFNPSTKRYEQTHKDILGGEAGGETIVAYHQEILNLVECIYNEIPEYRKEYISAVVLIPGEALGDAFDYILKFLQDTFDSASRFDQPDQIYQLSTQLFPLFCVNPRNSIS